jgi:hypothetical protein
MPFYSKTVTVDARDQVTWEWTAKPAGERVTGIWGTTSGDPDHLGFNPLGLQADGYVFAEADADRTFAVEVSNFSGDEITVVVHIETQEIGTEVSLD